jgi:hypothetical protein
MSMVFIIILILTTLAIAGSAAYFSIYGLAAIFSGIFWPVILMGGSLEAGKLVAASYVYRYRDSISRVMKIYLISAILVLMLITSAGIFGFLSMGYQQDTLPLKQQEQQITLLQSEQVELENFKKERLARRKQIDADIAALPNNFITGRQRLMKSYGPELEQLRNDIGLYTRQIGEKTIKISELKQQKLISEVHTGPIIFIAKAFATETDDATKWMIMLIMFAFDPLAVALTLGVNHAILQRKNKMGGQVEHGLEIVEHVLSDDISSKTNLEDIRPTANISTDELKAVLAEMQNKKLTSTEMAQMGMLEEMLERKLVTEKIRNPNKNS